MILVFDSSAPIALAQIGRLDLLHQLAGEVHIPAAVLEEVAAPGDERAGGVEVRRAPWIQVNHVADRQTVERLRGRLGRGESESIVLAREFRQTSSFSMTLPPAASQRGKTPG